MSVSRRNLLAGGVAALTASAALAMSPTAQAATTYTVVNCTYLNVRTGPSTGYAIVGRLYPGAVIVGTLSGGWVKIASGAYAGRYVSGSYLRAGGSTGSRYVTAITPVTGGVYLRLGWTGTRVYLVRRKFGMSTAGSAGGTYDSATRDRVLAFQRANGLAVDGIVGPATWAKLNTGYSFTIDAYQVKPQVSLSATTSQRITAMVNHALAQRGSRYTWGGAGPYNLGFDCSGLALQSLYAGGYDPQPINVLKHAGPNYRTSQELYNHTGFKSIPLAQRQRGDLIFFGNSSGAVHHVAIYLGDGTMMEAYGATAAIRRYSAQYGSSYVKPYVKRAFF